MTTIITKLLDRKKKCFSSFLFNICMFLAKTKTKNINLKIVSEGPDWQITLEVMYQVKATDS